MRVLFVNRMASIERGGGETFDLEISRCLEKSGVEIHYLSGQPLFSGAETPIEHPSSHTLRSPYFGWFPWDVVKGGWRLRTFDFDSFSKAAARWVLAHEEEFDVIQVCELPTFVHDYKRRGGRRPVMMRLTAPNFYDPHEAMKQADGVMASGTSIEKIRAQLRPDCHNIPNGVDLDRFKPQASRIREGLGVSNEDPVFIYVARFQNFKDHDTLVQAFHQVIQSIPNARLWCIGSGPLEKRIVEKLQSLSLTDRVHLAGEVPFEDIPLWYAAANVKVVSSIYESFCFGAIEAMATGLPLVSTDCGWVPALMGGQATPEREECTQVERLPGGLISPVGNADLLASSMVNMLQDDSLKNDCGAWNRDRAVERHGWDASASMLADAYQSLVKGKEAPA